MIAVKAAATSGTVVLWLACSRVALAQSCAMCYASAAAANDAGTKALQHGIEILMLPPLLIFVGIFVAAFRRSRRDNA